MFRTDFDPELQKKAKYFFLKPETYQKYEEIDQKKELRMINFFWIPEMEPKNEETDWKKR